MLHLLLFLALTLAIISMRARLMGANGGVVPRRLSPGVVNTLAVLLPVAIAAWGFLTFTWFWPLVAFLFANLVVQALVARGRWPALCPYVPRLEWTAVALGLVLWAGYWPLR